MRLIVTVMLERGAFLKKMMQETIGNGESGDLTVRERWEAATSLSQPPQTLDARGAASTRPHADR
jgi:hypothetical protein